MIHIRKTSFFRYLLVFFDVVMTIIPVNACHLKKLFTLNPMQLSDFDSSSYFLTYVHLTSKNLA